MKTKIVFLWLGLSLSSLFFYPLLESINQDIYFFHWNSVDTLELSLSWILLGVISSLFLFLIEKIKSQSLKLFSTSLLILIPFIFYFLQIIRMAGLKNELAAFVGVISKYELLTLIILFSFMVLIYLKKELVLAIENKLVLIFSFLNIYFIVCLLNLFFLHGAENFNSSLEQNFNQKNDTKKESVFFIVFDELSYQYLYENSKVKKDFKNIREFSNNAKNFHMAYAPGTQTLVSMPSYISGRKLNEVQINQLEINIVNNNGELIGNPFQDENIFSLAKSLGFHTTLIGWYHNYCAFMSVQLDFCSAYSLYKFIPEKDTFSLLHPIASNFILLPYQKPTGILKIQASMRSHKNTVANILSSSKYTMEKFYRSFQFFHFPIPHSPFIFDGNQYVIKNDAYIQNDKNYKNQLKLVDIVFGEIIDQLKQLGIYETSSIILTSDHNYRVMFNGEENARVPLLIKPKDSSYKIDIYDQVFVQEELLNVFD